MTLGSGPAVCAGQNFILEGDPSTGQGMWIIDSGTAEVLVKKPPADGGIPFLAPPPLLSPLHWCTRYGLDENVFLSREVGSVLAIIDSAHSASLPQLVRLSARFIFLPSFLAGKMFGK